MQSAHACEEGVTQENLSSLQNKFHSCELVVSTAPALHDASIHIAEQGFPHRTAGAIRNHPEQERLNVRARKFLQYLLRISVYHPKRT